MFKGGVSLFWDPAVRKFLQMSAKFNVFTFLKCVHPSKFVKNEQKSTFFCFFWFFLCFSSLSGHISSMISCFQKMKTLLLPLGMFQNIHKFIKKHQILHLEPSLFRCGLQKKQKITFFIKHQKELLFNQEFKLPIKKH